MSKRTDKAKPEPEPNDRDERVKIDMDPEEALKLLLRTPPERPAPKK